jgi:hypothetical protein
MEDLNDKITGGTLTAAEWNQVPSEIQNVIEALGITLSSGDVNQLGKAIAGYVANGNFYTDSGSANAYVLTSIGSKQSLTAYTDGAVFEFIAGNVNTGASTVNVESLGVKNIKLADGTNPAAGQIDGRVTLKFDSANDRCELIASGQFSLTVKTSGTTYTPPPGVKSLLFIGTGAGGGGGAVDGQGAGTSALGRSGGGGGTAIKYTRQIEASYTYSIGAGGTGGTGGGNGSDGGNTTVTSTNVNLTCNGGTGGGGHTGISGSLSTGGVTGGAASGGDLNLDGGHSTNSSIVSGDPANPSDAGGSFWGGGVRGRADNPGFNGAPFGTGGGGGGSHDVATDRSGGDGADGVLVIFEFF